MAMATASRRLNGSRPAKMQGLSKDQIDTFAAQLLAATPEEAKAA